jgi:hypothetical protein
MGLGLFVLRRKVSRWVEIESDDTPQVKAVKQPDRDGLIQLYTIVPARIVARFVEIADFAVHCHC